METWGRTALFPMVERMARSVSSVSSTVRGPSGASKPDTPLVRGASHPSSSPSRSWKAKVSLEPNSVAVFKVPFDVKEIFGKARPPIVVTINGYSFRSTIAVYGGESIVGVRRSHREAAKLVPGKTVTITITLDDAPRVVEPP